MTSNDSQPLFRSRVIYALGQIAQSVEDKRVNDVLINALGDKNAEVRQRSAFAIGRAKIDSAQSKLTNLLTDSATEVRQSAAESLYMLGNTSDDILNVLFITLYDKSWLIRRNAIWALQRIEDTRAVDPLIKVLKTDTQRGIRSYAATALGHLKDDRALSPLLEALKDIDEMVRVAVVKALPEVGTHDVLPHLSESLFDNHPAVQQAVNEIWEKYNYQ